jgi:hypothetical protein
VIVDDTTRIQLRGAKGLRYLARLLSQPGREVLVTDLDAQTKAAWSEAAENDRR